MTGTKLGYTPSKLLVDIAAMEKEKLIDMNMHEKHKFVEERTICHWLDKYIYWRIGYQ
jgi:hypothetical protein